MYECSNTIIQQTDSVKYSSGDKSLEYKKSQSFKVGISVEVGCLIHFFEDVPVAAFAVVEPVGDAGNGGGTNARLVGNGAIGEVLGQ